MHHKCRTSARNAIIIIVRVTNHCGMTSEEFHCLEKYPTPQPNIEIRKPSIELKFTLISVTICSLIFFICTLEMLNCKEDSSMTMYSCGVPNQVRKIWCENVISNRCQIGNQLTVARTIVASFLVQECWTRSSPGIVQRVMFHCIVKEPFPPTKYRNPKTEHRVEIYLNISDYMKFDIFYLYSSTLTSRGNWVDTK